MKKCTLDEFLKVSNGQQRTEFTSDVTHLVCAGDHRQFIQGLTLKMSYALLDGICIVDIGWIYDSVIKGHLLDEDDYKIIGEPRFGKWPTGIDRRFQFSCQILGDLEEITYDEMKCLVQKMGGHLVEGKEMEPVHVILAEAGNIASRKFPDAIDKQWVFDSIIRGALQDRKEYMISSKEAHAEGRLTDLKIDDVRYKDDHEESKLENCCPESSAEWSEEDYSISGSEEEDSDYVPNSCSEQEETDDYDAHDKKQKKGEDESESEESTIIPKKEHSFNKIVIQKSVKVNEKRTQKVHSCLFCEKCYQKIPRHLEQIHANEPEVAKVLTLIKGSRERKDAWELLLRKGDYIHNYNTTLKEDGVLLLKYRSREGEERDPSQYIPCEFCLAFVVKNDLWKHQKHCRHKPDKLSDGYRSAVTNSRLLLPVPDPKPFYMNILYRMRDDSQGVTAALKSDSLTKEFGLRQYEKLGHHQQNHQYISQKMKELGRLLDKIKEINPAINSLEKCLYPANWEDLIKAVKKVAGFDDESHKYSIPSLPLKLGYSLKKCAAILKNKAIKEGDEEKKVNAQSFLDLYNDEWSYRIAAHALDTLHEAHYNKPCLLPLVDDVLQLHQYLEKRAKELILQVTTKTDLQNTYFELAKICLCQIILFNRKRSGEAQRLKIADLKKGLILENSGTDKEVKESLSKFEVLLCETHRRIETRGKRGRKVSIILTKKMEQNIQVLIDNRYQVGVTSEFLFGRADSAFTHRGSDALREMAHKSGAKHPSRITSTNLRMQLATLCQVLGLSSNSQDILAKFLGHDIRIHREFYRLPDNTLELAKVTKVLHAFNTGNIGKYKGMDFDEIEFDASETFEPEDDIDADASDDSMDDFQDDQDSSPQLPSKKRRIEKTLRERTLWTREEQEAAKRQLNRYIEVRKLPGKLQCQNAKIKEAALTNRSWQQIKHFIRNRIVKVSKNLNQGICTNRQISKKCIRKTLSQDH